MRHLPRIAPSNMPQTTKSSADRHVRWLETSTKCSNIYTVHQLCLTGRSQADNSRHSKVNSRQSGSASRTGAGHHVRHPVYSSGLRPRGRQRRQEPSPIRQKREIPCTQAVARHNERPQTIMALISRVPAPMLSHSARLRPICVL